MAESAVKFLIQQLGPLLAEEVKLQKGLREEVIKIRVELESMQAFLRDADAKEHHSESIKAWVRQVRNAAYDTTDLLDEFTLHIEQYQQQHNEDNGGICGFLCRMAQCIKQLMTRHQIGKQIQNMRVQFSEISKRKEDYNLHKTEQVLTSSSNLEDEVLYNARLVALFTKDSQLVGIDEPKARIINWLLSKDQQRLSTMSVVGMGGLGKTTLVKKVYDSQQVKNHFETYAWITMSETFKKMELLRDMIEQFYREKKEQVPFELSVMTGQQLIQVLRDYLQKKRFMLVADDVWEVNSWKALSLALPVHENGSRVILTMRRCDVSSSCCIEPSDYIYQLQPLDSKSAWSLFCRRAFPTIVDEKSLTLSLELKELAQSFVSKCRGLPLAIVTLGGLLATKDQTYATWERMHRSFGSELDSDNELKNMMEILWLSFNDLPYYLKSCFLYLSIFPEDSIIDRENIISLWMAEDFIERKKGKTLEEVGESYFYALFSRSLIQAVGSNVNGDVITFRIHDLLREIIISKSHEENLIVSSSDIEGKITLSNTVRRLSIYHNTGEMVPKCESSSSSSHLRSFFIFGKPGQSITSSIITSFAGLLLLRVLSISNIHMDTFPEHITTLLHLRYLSLCNLNVKHLPSSIGKLRNLETLIIEDTFICELPMEIYNLQRLRLLSISRELDTDVFHAVDGVKVPSGLRSLKCLQELRKLEVANDVVKELEKLTQLRTLEILKLKREDGHNLCNSIEKMRHLKYLEVCSIEEDEEINLHSLLNPPLTLQGLLFYGYLKKLPDWIFNLKDLRTLNLGWSGLKDDPLKALSSLSNLVLLNIAFDAYEGDELCAKEGEYPKLKLLSLQLLRGLKKITLERGAMHNLEVLLIDECELLAVTPCWLRHLTNLKELALTNMPMPFLKSLQSDDGAQRANFIQHIPLVSHYDSESSTTQKF